MANLWRRIIDNDVELSFSPARSSIHEVHLYFYKEVEGATKEQRKIIATTTFCTNKATLLPCWFPKQNTYQLNFTVKLITHHQHKPFTMLVLSNIFTIVHCISFPCSPVIEGEWDVWVSMYLAHEASLCPQQPLCHLLWTAFGHRENEWPYSELVLALASGLQHNNSSKTRRNS